MDIFFETARVVLTEFQFSKGEKGKSVNHFKLKAPKDAQILEGVTLVLSGEQLSDLFFNYQNDRSANYLSRCSQKDGQRYDEMEFRKFLREDVEEFCELYGLPKEMAIDLHADYLERM